MKFNNLKWKVNSIYQKETNILNKMISILDSGLKVISLHFLSDTRLLQQLFLREDATTNAHRLQLL